MKKKSNIIMITLILLFLPFTVANAGSLDLETIEGNALDKGNFNEENVIEVDFDSPNSDEVKLNLTSDFNADFEDLLDQLKNQSEEYSNLKNELTSSESGHKNNDLKIQLKNEEDKLESIAEHLLSLRYTDDKNRLRQHIIDIAMGENYELDNASDPYVLTMGVSSRANTGNYAFEDSTLFGDTNYNHDSQNNTSGVQTTEFYLPTTANVHSGAYILTQEGSSEEPALYPDISWRALTFNGTCRTSIQEDNSTAGFNIRNIFYDVSSNSAYYHEYLRDYCTTSGQ